MRWALQDVSKVAGLGSVEQGHDLATCEFFGCEGGADQAGGGRLLRWAVQGEVDQQVVGAVDDEAAERCLARMRSMAQPCSWAAAWRASLVAGTLVAPTRVKKSVWFSPDRATKRFGLSASTRSEGLAHLCELGLVHSTSKPVSESGAFIDFQRRRKSSPSDRTGSPEGLGRRHHLKACAGPHRRR